MSDNKISYDEIKQYLETLKTHKNANLSNIIANLFNWYNNVTNLNADNLNKLTNGLKDYTYNMSADSYDRLLESLSAVVNYSTSNVSWKSLKTKVLSPTETYYRWVGDTTGSLPPDTPDFIPNIETDTRYEKYTSIDSIEFEPHLYDICVQKFISSIIIGGSTYDITFKFIYRFGAKIIEDTDYGYYAWQYYAWQYNAENDGWGVYNNTVAIEGYTIPVHTDYLINNILGKDVKYWDYLFSTYPNNTNFTVIIDNLPQQITSLNHAFSYSLLGPNGELTPYPLYCYCNALETYDKAFQKCRLIDPNVKISLTGTIGIELKQGLIESEELTTGESIFYNINN